MLPVPWNTIPVYPLMWGVAATVAVAFGSMHAARALGLPRWRCAVAMVLLTLSVLIGSKLLYLLEARYYPHDDYVPLAVRGLLHGFRIPGGIVLLAIAMPIVCRVLRLPTGRFGDAVIPMAAFALVFIRLGCFLNSCCFGKVSSLPWAVRFPRQTWVFWYHETHGWIPRAASASLPVHPLQLYFLGAALAALVALVWQQRLAPYAGRTQLLFYATFFVTTAAFEPLRENYLTLNNWLAPLAAAIATTGLIASFVTDRGREWSLAGQ